MKNKFPLKLISWYQKTKSGPPKCRFLPSCSNYAKECYQKFGFVKASYLTTKRFLKCNRFFKGGYDPVPLTKEEKAKVNEESQKKQNDD